MKHLTHGLLSLLVGCLVLAGSSAGAASGPGSIVTPPQSQTIFVSDPVTFTVVADGTAPLSYQWYRNSSPILGATGTSYTIARTVQGDDGALFSVSVSNSLGGALSPEAVLLIDPGIMATNAVALVPFNLSWRYNQANTDLGTTWRNIGYNDTGAGWSSGPGVFDAKTTPRTSIGGETVGTQLVLGNPGGTTDYTTYYFRTHFNFSWSNLVSVTFQGTLLSDDGAALYLNGQTFASAGVVLPTVFSDWATRTIGDAAYEDLVLNTNLLVEGDNLLAAEAKQINLISSDITFGFRLIANVVTRTRDTQAPTVSYIPGANSVVRTLPQIEVRFSEAVQGVDVSDLLINGVPASDLLVYGAEQYVFRFPEPPTGTVQVAWAPGHGITDLSANRNPFAGGSFAYMLDPNASFSDLRINEIMAANSNGLRDEDGDVEDWIELYNGGTSAIDLAGWYLTDNVLSLRQWQFPSVSLQPGQHLIVWASQKDRRVSNAPLHTNFKLEKNGEYLALVLPDGVTVASSFSPYFPVQFTDISYGCDPIDPSLFEYFSTPSPGRLNSGAAAGLGLGPEVKFSRKSGTFRSAFPLELSINDSNFVIRYYLVTNATTAAATDVPSATSPLYTGPITVSGAMQVRARAYPTRPGYFAGPAHSESYLQIDAGAAAFTSDLPLVIWHNFGAGIPPTAFTSPGAVGVFMVFDTNNPTGRASLTNDPVVACRAGAHIRGSSTEGQAKKNLAIEAWAEVNYDDQDIEVLDMPADSDWILYAPNQFDRTYLHNPIAQALGRQMGHSALRTRFAELFFNTAGGVVTYPSPAGGNYNGIYVIEEKIKVGKNRLDIDRLDPQDTNAVSITGGYILKIDRNTDPADVNSFTPGAWPSTAFPWITANHAGWNTQPIVFVDQNGIYMGQNPIQRQWLVNYINAFDSSLVSPNWTNRVTGYAAYVDIDQWIENHMLNTIPMNVDGYRLSGFFYKERDKAGYPGSGKLKQGPLWDFDRTQGTGAVDPRPFNPRQWKRPISGDQGTDMFGNNDNTTGTRLGVRWWWQLFHDPDFWQRWVDKWQDLRENGLYQTTNVMALIDRLGNEVRQAAPRNASRWSSGDSIGTPETGSVTADGYTYNFTNATYQGEIDWQKKWWTDRLDFVETNFLPRPKLSVPGQEVAPGYIVTVNNPPGIRAGTVTYYTLDGTDPRLPGGHISPSALSATAPFTITINQNARVFLRNRNPNHSNPTNASLTAIGGNPPLSTPWSGTRIETYYVSIPDLRITEIMYHPADPLSGTNDTGAFEYIEVKNIGATPLNVTSFRLRGGIEFEFPNLVLPAGEYAVVVKNVAAFTSRYNAAGVTIAGVFTNDLGNDGDHLILEGRLREPILDFEFKDSWYPITDGPGFSLQIVDPNLPLETVVNGTNAPTWGLKSSWRPSGVFGGTPGSADPGAPVIPTVYVNEASTHTDPPFCDSIELYNPNADAVDVSGWYLTDSFGSPTKYRIPSGTIAAHGYLVFYETNSFGAAFGLSSLGDDIYLFSGDATTNLTGYYHGFDFGAQANGATFGRYVISTGNDHFVTQIAPTLGATNSGPKVGPVVISELMYYPPELPGNFENFRDEFIELHNVTGSPVPLFDPAHPTNTWRIQGGVSHPFPQDITLPAHGHLLVVSFDPATNATQTTDFRARYNVPPETPIYGPWEGHLDNVSDSVELMRPDLPNPPPLPTAGYVPYILAERVRYSNAAPWPSAAGIGVGLSLQRIDAARYGNDPINWVAGGPGAGQQFQPGGSPPVVTTQPSNQTVTEGQPASLSVAVTGAGPFTYLWRHDGTNFGAPNSATLSFASTSPTDQGAYAVIVLGAAGATASDNAYLTVHPLPVIVTHPKGASVTNSSAVTMNVVATGNGSLSYQWRRNGTAVPGATASSYTIASAQWDVNDGYYTVVVTDDYGARESAPALVTVRTSISITQPLVVTPSMSVLEGRSLTMSIAFQSSFPEGGTAVLFRHPTSIDFAVQRYFANSNLAVLTIENVRSNLHAGAWRILITNGVSQPQTNFTISVVSAAPFFTLQPTNQSASLGGTVLLASEARGTDPIGYRWYLNATNPVPNATNATLTISNLQAASLGDYSVIASNRLGMATSEVAQVTALALAIDQQPTNQTATVCSDATFTVAASGAGDLSYQWYFNNTVSLPGATASTLTLLKPQPAQAGGYLVVVSTTSGSVTSDVATLTVVLGDQDNDGMPDAWELSHGFNPCSAADRDADADGDGRSNWEEYVSGTDPHSASSVLEVTIVRSNGVHLRFSAQANVAYTVQYRTNVASGTWEKLADVPAELTDHAADVSDPNGGTGSRFYRIVTPMQ